MFETLGINRRFIVLLAGAFFIVGPLLAWGLYLLISHVPDRSSNDIKQAITKYYDEQAGKGVLPEVQVVSFKKTDPSWYLVEYKFGEEATNGKYVVVGDFTSSSEDMVVVSDPSTGFRRENISGLGVPYSLVDELTEKLEHSAHDEEGEA